MIFDRNFPLIIFNFFPKLNQKENIFHTAMLNKEKNRWAAFMDWKTVNVVSRYKPFQTEGFFWTLDVVRFK